MTFDGPRRVRVRTRTLAYSQNSTRGGEPMIDRDLTRLCVDAISARSWRQWVLEQGTPADLSDDDQ
jgi:hypothetical protein